jgi:hypothetical protein
MTCKRQWTEKIGRGEEESKSKTGRSEHKKGERSDQSKKRMCDRELTKGSQHGLHAVNDRRGE